LKEKKKLFNLIKRKKTFSEKIIRGHLMKWGIACSLRSQVTGEEEGGAEYVREPLTVLFHLEREKKRQHTPSTHV